MRLVIVLCLVMWHTEGAAQAARAALIEQWNKLVAKGRLDA